MAAKHRFDISIIGAGNVGASLARAFEDAGHVIHEVFSRKEAHARSVAAKLYDAVGTAGYDFSGSKAQIFIVAVTDNAIYDVVCRLSLPANALLLHTSGTQSMDVLDAYAGPRGVMYPLQTFVKGTEVSLLNAPLLLEASTNEAMTLLNELAQSMSRQVCMADHRSRKTMHLAAVFASNFVNRMMTVAKDLAEEAGLKFELLYPLIRETVEKALKHGPENTLTGPAKRGDTQTLDAHRQLIKQEYEELLPIYDAITDNILRFAAEE